MTATNEAILKSDRRGRCHRYSSEQRATLVEAYQASGLRRTRALSRSTTSTIKPSPAGSRSAKRPKAPKGGGPGASSLPVPRSGGIAPAFDCHTHGNSPVGRHQAHHPLCRADSAGRGAQPRENEPMIAAVQSLDTLLLNVRNPESKKHAEEAVNAYQ